MKNILSLILIGTGFCSSTSWGLECPPPPIVKVSTALVTRTSSRPKPPSPTGLSLMQTALLQAALDRNGFGVGLIDGQAGSRTTLALRDYARSRGLSEPNARTELLSESEPATVIHALTNDDLTRVGTAPGDWVEAEKVTSMACGSLDEVLSERFHVSRHFLQRLNPALTNWPAVTAGTEITVPNTRPSSWSVPASRLEVDCSEYRIRAFGATNDLIASFPCSIARKLHKVPVGDLTLVAFAPNPNYTFDPENFPESARAQEIGRKIIIPPGPRNPVGVYWLSLSAPGFGMHGTPHPETIGRRESHGCFRLTNWDITTLASMVEAGTPVRVMNVPAEDTQ
jgi:peptidoglycan hydrolase-like protein with peptidoglycan-binding domain